jgi:hypothetical protein
MTDTTKKVDSLQQGFPSGTLVGRTAPGIGPAQHISIADIARAVAATGIVATPGMGGGGLPSIADADLLANTSGGSAKPVGTTLSAFLDYVFTGVSKGDVLYRDTSVWKRLGIGSTGQVLTVSGGIPAWGSAGSGSGGAMSLVSTLTASSSANLAWTGLAQGTSWKLVGRLLVPANNSVGMGAQFGTGAGPTYITTGYEFAFKVQSSANASGDFGAEGQGVAPADDGTTANASPGTSFDLTIVTDNANFVQCFGTCTFKSGSHWKSEMVGATVATSGPVTAIKLAFGAGNITSGNASLYTLAA